VRLTGDDFHVLFGAFGRKLRHWSRGRNYGRRHEIVEGENCQEQNENKCKEGLLEGDRRSGPQMVTWGISETVKGLS
jgi:hypothetical protein